MKRDCRFRNTTIIQDAMSSNSVDDPMEDVCDTSPVNAAMEVDGVEDVIDSTTDQSIAAIVNQYISENADDEVFPQRNNEEQHNSNIHG